MSREERKLRKHFEASAKREQRKANKYLSKTRASERKPPRERIDARRLDRDQDLPPAKKKKSRIERETPALPGFIAEIGPGYCDILHAGTRTRCRFTGEIAIGDRVLFSPGRRRVQEVLPRRTALSRTDPHNPRLERVIAANVDIVVNVVSLKSPPLRPGLIDRYLIAIGKSGAEPLLCVNKIDLLTSPDELEPLRPYQDLGLTVITCSATTGEGLDALSEALADKTCVFAGHSGVGKSSLLNALDPRLDVTTSTVSEANEKGRHTTTSSALYHLPNGAIVIDTPGIREFGLWDVSQADLGRYYRDFAGHNCAFSDCKHTHEPDCGVKQAVAAGKIATIRYEGYLRILTSL
jgi:ribosome biogenesis GTPase / thiamine phosphate phosphatase